MANGIFAKVLAMGPIDDEWGVEEQTDDQIIFKGAFGHAAVSADGKVTSKVSKYVEMLEAAIKGEELPVKPAKGSVPAVRPLGKITSRSHAGSAPGSALDAVRECQATQLATYSTGKGKKAASAKTNIAALMEAGGSLEVIKRIHEIDYIEVVGRATLNGQMVDSSRSFFKQEYLAKKAWEWIIKVLIKEPEIVVGTDAYGMPEFREGAIIKVRVSDDEKNSFLVALPAKIALWREMAREWQAAGRVCETVAYSRACDMILRQDFQCKEEIAEEQAEVDGIQNRGVPQ